MLMQTHEARLDALRKELARQGLDGFVIPISDEHLSEYVGAYAQRLAWLTGFGGSAGTAAVLKDKAAMFVDGRYTLQVRDQVDGRFYAYESVPQTSVAKWLGEHAPANVQGGARIGYDPWLHGKAWVAAATKALAGKGGELVAVESNPIDAIWEDRPAPSAAPALVHEDRYAGRPSEAKRAAVSEWLAEKKLDAAVEMGSGLVWKTMSPEELVRRSSAVVASGAGVLSVSSVRMQGLKVLGGSAPGTRPQAAK